MLSLDLAIDLEALADAAGLLPFELEVYLCWFAMSLGFALACAGIVILAVRRNSPVGRFLNNRHFGGV